MLTHLGDTRQAAGAGAAARKAWMRSLRLPTELDHPDAEHVSHRLRTNEYRGWNAAVPTIPAPCQPRLTVCAP
jgi:hypothetical protein